MKVRTSLTVFDFDETLFRVPSYTCSESKGLEPYEWFDDPKSLSTWFNIRGIANSIEAARDESEMRILITHRVKACESQVRALLSQYKVTLDGEHFLGRGSEKSDVVLKTLEAWPELTTLTVYEDSLWEIIKYTNALEKAVEIRDLKVEFKFVDKSKIITIDWRSARSLNQFSQAERLRLV